MYEKAALVFWVTLILYITTLLTVSYVGVYLTYIAIPLIATAGLIMTVAKPKKKSKKLMSKTAIAIKEVCEATENVFSETNLVLDEMNRKLEIKNTSMRLTRERTCDLKGELYKLKNKIEESNINIKYSDTEEEKDKYKKILSQLNDNVLVIESKIKNIKKECELEAQSV